MSETLRNKVLAAFEIYAEGGSTRQAREKVGISGKDFFKVIRADPALEKLYYDIQRNRGDMAVDEVYETATDTNIQPSAAREKGALLLKIAGLYDRKRFGDKVALEIEAGPSLTAAIDAARRRALQPPCDLANVIDVESRTIPPLLEHGATDKQSVPAVSPPPNPFDD